MTSPVGVEDCTVSVYVGEYCATAVRVPSIANVMDFCPTGCAALFTVHCRKVYPAGSVAGATRFTLVPYATAVFE